MQTDIKQLFLLQPQHRALPTALHPCPLLPIWVAAWQPRPGHSSSAELSRCPWHCCSQVQETVSKPNWTPHKGPGPWFSTSDGWSKAVAGEPGKRGDVSNWLCGLFLTRALASPCNSSNKPAMGFCSNSWELSCLLKLLGELHWSCSHCCHTEISSLSLSTQMLLIAESWDEFMS